MRCPGFGRRLAGGELFLGELADRLQDRKPGMPRGAICQERQLAHQSIEQIEKGIVVGVVKSCYRAGTFEIKAAGEHRTAVQQHLLRVVEQVVRPGHRMTERLVARQAAPRADQQPETVIEAITHVAGGHRRHPRGRQLDGQTGSRPGGGRYPPPQPRRRRCSTRSARQRSEHVQRTVPPPPSRCPPPHPGTAPATVARRRPPTLRGWWPGSSPSPRPRGSPRPDQPPGRAHARSVEHQQLDSALQRGRHRLAHALSRLLSDAQHRRHCIRHRTRIGDRSQLEKPDTVGELIDQARRDLQRQACLAHTPTPVKVTTRCSRSAACTSTRSAPRPTKLEAVGRRFPGLVSSARNAGKSVCRPGARACLTWASIR